MGPEAQTKYSTMLTQAFCNLGLALIVHWNMYDKLFENPKCFDRKTWFISPRIKVFDGNFAYPPFYQVSVNNPSFLVEDLRFLVKKQVFRSKNLDSGLSNDFAFGLPKLSIIMMSDNGG